MRCDKCLGEMVLNKLDDGMGTVFESYICSNCGYCDYCKGAHEE